MSEPTRYVLVRRPGLRLDEFARRANLHPDLVRRLVTLGVLEGRRDTQGELWFEPSSVAAAARVTRLRTGLGLNYASIGLVTELLNRIEILEARTRRA